MSNKVETRSKVKWRWWVIVLVCLGVILVLGGLCARMFWVRGYFVPAESMAPTIEKGDLIIVDFGTYDFSELKRGDVVALTSPRDSKKRLVKRVIGLPGDTVEIKEKQVFINGKALDESYTIYVGGSSEYTHSLNYFAPDVVPENHLFVLGDNRYRSADSRIWGFVAGKLVEGKVKMIYFSLDPSNKRIRWNRIGKAVH